MNDEDIKICSFPGKWNRGCHRHVKYMSKFCIHHQGVNNTKKEVKESIKRVKKIRETNYYNFYDKELKKKGIYPVEKNAAKGRINIKKLLQ